MPSLLRLVEPSITLFPRSGCRSSRYLAFTVGATQSKHPCSSASFRIQPRRMKSDSSLPWEQIVPQAHCISPKSITRHEVLEMLEGDQKPGADFLLVDVRKDDHQVKEFRRPFTMATYGRFLLTILMQGLTISGSLNMPIQTLQPSLSTLYRFCVTAEIKKVIFYCGERYPSRL